MIFTTHAPATTSQQTAASAITRKAILRALAYSDIFDYAPDRSDLYSVLELPGISYAHFEQALHDMEARGIILFDNERCILAGREALSTIWRRRQQHSLQKQQSARRYTALIRCLPFIRVVAITGTLAAHNAEATDDIDLFLITAPGRVWLARALTILIVRLAALFGTTLCPNYLISTGALELAERNLYTARELAQMQPLYGAAWYHQFRARNRWTLDYLPNAGIGAFPTILPLDRLPWTARLLKRLGERLLGGRLGTILDRWEMRRKVQEFLQERTPVAPEEASFSPEQCKGHFEGHAAHILRRFHERAAAVLAAEEG
jgi:hypothetical protein